MMISSMLVLVLGFFLAVSDIQAIDVGEKARDFTLESLYAGSHAPGGKVSFTQFLGKVIVLDFWATWCEPCEEELPLLERLQNKYGKERVAVVTVNVDDQPEKAIAFLKRRRLGLLALWDAQKYVAGIYDIPRMPSSFLIDQNGIIRFIHTGFEENDIRHYESEIESLLAKTKAKQ